MQILEQKDSGADRFGAAQRNPNTFKNEININLTKIAL
jgi:hypothetical protein